VPETEDEFEFKLAPPRGKGELSPHFMDGFEEMYEQMRPLMDALRKGYCIDGRSFIRGEEHLLSSEELAWLNQKLQERHCLPVERY
jgi:hypothetical protein